MGSTFHGLHTAYKGLMAQQQALKTTGHNIANANTPGYSRQRVNFSASQAFPAPGMNAPSIPGQIGTGVDVDSVQRIRNEFLDQQFRGEHGKAGYWEKVHESYIRMEDIMNEPTDHGLSSVMDEFWQALQVLADNPNDNSAREVVRQQGEALADTYNYMQSSLQTVQIELDKELEASVNKVNNLMQQIQDLSNDINRMEPHGYVPNDLYDQRDRLIDELSEYLPIEVERVGEAGGNSHPIAMGPIQIHLTDANGDRIEDGLIVPFDDLPALVYEDGGISINEITDLGNLGKISALHQSVHDTYPNMMGDLQDMMSSFVDAFNGVHNDGSDESVDFFNFSGDTLELSEAIRNNIQNINAGSSGSSDGSNALLLAAEIDELAEGYRTIIGQMAVKTSNAARNDYNSQSRLSTIDGNRMAMSAVSLDEEMVNMITFQHAYNAAARQITVIDEMLDTIINRMGVVGR
ncbi:flagellar hook-associated protein FlgK [Geomicrobium sp. JSM 1781026]|uniref:flagellar hook-associated protein FlgK n=1 Tax=Geomicrobium sp. JSM 1781026 TaxID=3344580 RepID=UPI0035BEF730